jgi:two-component system, OmpR family, KDP operon response regulator KdpE
VVRILVVDGDASLRQELATTLGAQGYEVTEAGTAEEAVVLVGHDVPDLVLLDLVLPGVDGFHALRRLRSFSRVPVVVLTARAGTADKVAALDGGADDYVVKPFDLDELLARVRAALRHRPDAHVDVDAATVVIGDLVIDRARGRLTRAGEPVHLTPTELRLLDLLVNSDGRLLTYSHVAQHLGTQRKELEHGTLRVFVAQLRKKLGDDAADPKLIATHFGVGYRWVVGDVVDQTGTATP